MLGSVLLISLVAIAVAIVLVVVVSQPIAEKVPNINPIITTYVESGQSYLNITHNGGDPLKETDSVIRNSDGVVSAGIWLQKANGEKIDWNGQTWTIGTSLLIPEGHTPSYPSMVAVVYKGGSSQRLLFAQGAVGEIKPVTTTTTQPVTTTTTQPVTTTTTQPVTSTPTPVITGGDVYLNTDKVGYIQAGGYMQFRVTGGNPSYILIGNKRITLNNGELVKLEIGSDGSGEIYMSSGMISTFQFNRVSLYINGQYAATGNINDIYVGNSDSFRSTMTLVAEDQTKWTDLKINGKSIIYGDWSDRIVCYNIGPDSTGILNLDTRSSTKGKVFFVGSATSVTY